MVRVIIHQQKRLLIQISSGLSKDKHGGNVHTSYIAQVKRMCGLDVGEDLEEFSDELKETVRAFAERYNWWGDDNKEIYDNLIFLMPPLIMFTCFTAEIL